MSEQRTEAPTPRRRDEARRKGEGVGRSHELAMALTLGVGLMGLSGLLPSVSAGVAETMRSAILETGQRGVAPALLPARLGDGIGQAVRLVLPLGVLVAVAGIAGNLISGGLVLSVHAVRFDGGRLNPARGLRRIADRQALLRLGVSTAKLALLAAVSWQVLGERVGGIVGLGGASAAAIAGSAVDAVFQLGLTVTVLLSVVALVDFVVQRRRASSALRMTREEVKREHRESEGDPMVQAQRRRRARQLAFARMMDAVPTADVVVTNPTRLAVVLKYDSLSMRAPRLVAKGQRLMAQRIREVARANGVPVVEDVLLARALFPRPLGSEVPPNLYRAVARILVIVHEARFGRGRRAGASARPRSAPTTSAVSRGRSVMRGGDR